MSTIEFHDYVTNDLLAEIDGIISKKMFGGYGLYRFGKIFAFIIDDALYFKVCDRNRHYFEKAGSKPFMYTHKSGKEIAMSYWELPSDVMDDRRLVAEWVERSCSC